MGPSGLPFEQVHATMSGIMQEQKAETQAVRNWWNQNPFTYNGSTGVGKIAEAADMDLAFFDRMDARYKKRSGGSTETAGGPVFSKFIDYRELRGKKVLDIATGTGFSTVAFAKAGAEVTGIDITEYAVDATKKNFALRGLSGDIRRMDAQNLEFPDATFDFVCAHGCLMHMPDTAKAVREIYRVLKPGGKVYAWMYHKGWYYYFNILFVRGILCGKLFTTGFNTLKMTSMYTDGASQGGNPHTKLYSKAEFEALFAQGSFKDIKVYVNYNSAEWYGWPMAKFSLGHKILTDGMRRFLDVKLRWGLGASITATKQ